MTEERNPWVVAAGSGGTAADDAPPEVELIEAEIEETRSELSETVDAIGAKLTPGNLMHEAKETVREATVGKVEHMASTAGQMVEEVGATAQQTGAGIVETIRRNPVPAAMVGIGLGMLWKQRSTMTTGGSWMGQGYGSTGYRSGSTGYGSGYGSGGNGSPLPERIGQGASDAVDTVRQTAGQAASTIGDTTGQIAQNVQDTTGQIAQNVQATTGQLAHNLQHTTGQVTQSTGQVVRQVGQAVQENPLAAGAVALAVGAAVGMALPTTRVERQALGETGERVIRGAESAISEPLRQMEEQAREA